MTTVSEFLEGQFAPSPSPAGGLEGAGAGAPVRARVAGTESDRKWAVRSWLGARAGTVAADVRAAWLWFGRPPTLAELWAGRVPSRDRVPGGNAGLWVAWVGFNHLVLPVFAVAWPLLFVLAHPARLLLAAPPAAALFFVWI